MTEILASNPNWKTNADLIKDVHTLGWITDHTLDLTHGQGTFWHHTKPPKLTTNDLTKPADYQYDWTGQGRGDPMPLWWPNHFDTVIFDPPYKLNGTPTDTNRYGTDQPATKTERIDDIAQGCLFALSCTRPNGWIHIKVQNQICGGRYIDLAGVVTNTLNMVELRAVWHFVTHPRPQPPGRRQRNPRNNVSYLLSFKR